MDRDPKPDAAEWDAIWDTLVLDQDTLVLDPHATITPRGRADTLAAIETALGELPPLMTSRTGEGAELTITRTLGMGGMGVVYLATQETIGREVAVKSILAERVSPTSSRELLREAWITGRLEHPNIIPVHALGVDEAGSPLFVMKRVEGVTWSDAIADPSRLPAFYQQDDPLDAHLSIFEDVCNAVHFANESKILHRDIKPDNVMLGAFGEVYLVDWGIALTLERDPARARHLPMAHEVDQVAGTPGYMAPEMSTGLGDDLGPWTDTYLLGATLHEIVTGRTRHEGNDLYSMMFASYVSAPYDYPDSVPAELAEICQRATSKERSERHASAEALRQAVAAFRRHRGSVELTARAEASLERLEALVARASGGDAADLDASILALDGEVRFGFERALEVWPESPRAARGLQRSRRLMCGFEIDRGRASAASALLASLMTPAPELAERLDALRRRLELERVRVAQLERLEHEQDSSVGGKTRGVVLILLALFWSLSTAGYSVLWHRGFFEHTSSTLFASRVLGISSVLLLLPLLPRLITINQFNLRFIATMGITLAMSLGAMGMCALVELPPHFTMFVESCIFASITFNSAVYGDRRVAPGGVLCVLGALGSLLSPEWSWEIVNTTNMLTLVLIGRVWFDPRLQRLACMESLTGEASASDLQ